MTPAGSSWGRGGVLSDRQLRELITAGAIGGPPLLDNQVQPNSIDLRLGGIAYRTRCSFLPVGRPVSELLGELSTNAVRLDPEEGYVMECGQTFVIPLVEHLALPADISGMTNPKSSTGRLDIMARVLADNGHAFDTIPAGYQGPLYVEIITRSFPLRVRPDDALVQLRLARDIATAALSDQELRMLIDSELIVRDPGGVPVNSADLDLSEGVYLSIDLGSGDRTIGFTSKKCSPVVDLRVRDLKVRDYWDWIYSPSRSSDPLILKTDGFYIFASRERVVVPPDVCAEMVAIDVRSGEVRTHYAGFFDSGFGVGCNGAHVVLEVRNMDVPFLIQDGQKLFRLRFFRNLERPEQLYGQTRFGSNYQGQRLKLAKQFSRTEPPADAPLSDQLELRWLARAGIDPAGKPANGHAVPPTAGRQ